jgi:hypothetical protein
MVGERSPCAASPPTSGPSIRRAPWTDSGLGLAIVASIAEAHGGQATVRTKAGEGTTTFTVHPAGCASPRAATGRCRKSAVVHRLV